MATVTVQASFKLNTGEVVDLETSMAEGTQTELKVSTDYAVAAVSIGQFADGKIITEILQPPSAPNMCSHAYIDRRGEILCVLPVGVAGVQNKPSPMLKSFVLQAGDTIQVMASTSSSRLFSLNTITNTGVHAIFSGTAASGNIALTHIKSGQGLGASLTGQTIVQHFATSIDDSKIDSGAGVYYLNDKGLPVGGVAACNPTNLQLAPQTMGGTGIFLNYVARVSCNS